MIAGGVCMVILSGPIFKRCYDVLNRCDIFEPEQKATLENALTAVGLDNHQYDHASNRPGQVHNIINYLLKQDVKEGKPVFWIFLDGLWRYGFLQENTSLYKDVKECCALIEIGYALQIDARVANKYDVNHIVKLVEYFFKYPILDDSDQCRQVMLQLPIEIRQKINQNGRNTATTSGVAILKASICFPDGPGKLASILYESEHESARWRELDELLRELYQTNVTYTRLQQLQSLLKPIELSNDILMDFYRA